MELLIGAFHSAGAPGLELASAVAASGAARRVRRVQKPAPIERDRAERLPSVPRWRGPRPDPEPIVGRTADLAHILDSVRHNRRVVLTGPGGVGKTRLALAAADRLRTAFRDGVAVVELGDLPTELDEPETALDRVRRAVLRAISHLRPGFGVDGDQVARADPEPLTDLQLLLVVDNAEHVLGAVTHLSQQLLDRWPGLNLIVTSRRPLAAPSAPVWEVGPLGCDPADERSEAVQLFLRRVQSACPTLNLTDRRMAVAELCAKLDGIPLALEMAALRIRSVPLDMLLREAPISQVLGQAGSAGLPHQRTLSDSVRWSYALLSEDQRELLHHLADFFGPFTIEDVERLQDGAPGELLGRLSALVDTSLVQVRRGPQYKYRLLGYVREFAAGIQLKGAAPLLSTYSQVASLA